MTRGSVSRWKVRQPRITSVKYRLRGFTFVEMTVLIIIIAVLSSMVVPAYTRFLARAEFDKTVQQVLGFLSAARGAAISSGSDCTVAYDPGQGAFIASGGIAVRDTDVPVAIEEKGTSLAGVAVEPLFLNPDVAEADLQAGGGQGGAGSTRNDLPRIVFHEDGSSNGAQITIAAASGYGVRMLVIPATGRVERQDLRDSL